MPTYSFKCRNCESMKTDVILRITHTETDKPVCCDQPMNYHIDTPPMVHWKDYDLPDGGFVAHSIPGRPVVTSLKQNKDLMERHDLVDANDFGPPPTQEEQFKEAGVMQESIDAITPSGKMEQELKEKGMMDMLDN